MECKVLINKMNLEQIKNIIALPLKEQEKKLVEILPDKKDEPFYYCNCKDFKVWSKCGTRCGLCSYFLKSFRVDLAFQMRDEFISKNEINRSNYQISLYRIWDISDIKISFKHWLMEISPISIILAVLWASRWAKNGNKDK